MKKNILLIAFIVSSQILLAQNNHKFSFSYGITANELIRTTSIEGSGSYNGEGSKIYTFGYTQKIRKMFSIKTGLSYSENEFIITAAPTGIDVRPFYSEIKLISIPVYANFNFGKYIFIDGGLIIGFEVNSAETRSIDNQTGIGFGLAAGLQYEYKQLGIFISPFFNIHSVIAFQKDNYQQHLTESGFKFGLSYSF